MLRIGQDVPPRALSGSAWRRLSLCTLPVTVGAFFFAGGAGAATFTSPCTFDTDPGVCERTTYLASQSETDIRLLGWLVGVVLFACVLTVLARTFRA